MKKFSLEEYLAHQEKKVVRRDGKAARIVCTDFQRSNGVFDIIVCFFVDKERELAYSVNTEGRRYENEETEDDIFFADDEKQLSEFEKALEVFLMNADSSEETFHEEVKKHAAELLALAREQFIKDGYVIEKKAFHDAVEKVAPEVMKEVLENVDKANEELSEFEKACIRLYQDGRDDGFAGDNLSDENLKECSAELLALARKELIKEGTSKNEMGTMLYDAGFEDGKAEALKDLPRWKKWGNGACGNPYGHPIALVSGAGGIRFVSVLGVTGEKYIMLAELKKLPGFKEDE